ncbi:MAG: lipopolysaccharide heptosyltransferase II [Ignavibacteriaceae bacterium]|jgi:heptosyltransferase-2|nr:lipopolysaccharide heptosyltransferase II [Ignavibacteriaceae bacterium]
MEILNQNKIVVIQTAFLGDAVLTLPMLEVLAEKNPNAKIDVVTIPKNSEIFLASPFVNDVIIYDKRNTHKGIKALFTFAKDLRKKNYDVIVAPHRSLRTSLLVLFSGIKESIGFCNSTFSLVYKHPVSYNYKLHETVRNISLISDEAENRYSKYLPKVFFTDEIKQKVDELFSSFSTERKTIAIASGSIWFTKRYPKEYFITISRALINKNYLILLIGSDGEYNLNEEIRQALNENCINLAGKYSIIETIYLLTKCSLLITNDSAPTHFGMAANIPVLTIYCSTVPDFGFSPYNEKSSSVGLNNLTCKPCGIHGYQSCPLSHFNCGQKLLPENVLEKLETLL